MIRLFILMTLLFFSLNSLSKENPKSGDLPQVTPQSCAEFINIYRTYGDFFAAFRMLNFVDGQQIDNVLSFLAKKGIQPTDSLTPAKIEKDKVSWGKLAMIKDAKSGYYKTSAGVILKVKPGEAFDALFIRLFNEFVDGKAYTQKSFWPNLLVSPAYAGKFSDFMNAAADATVTGATYAWHYVGEPAYSCVLGVTVGAVGQVAAINKAEIHLIRKAIYDGTVSCTNDGSYLIDNVELHYVNPAMEAAEAAMDSGPHTAVSKACDGLTLSGVGNMFELFAPQSTDCIRKKNCDVLASNGTLKRTFKGDPPDCTPANAKLVQAQVKKDLELKEKQIFTKLASRPVPGSDERPAQTSPMNSR